MRRIQVTREMAEWLHRKVSDASGFLLQSVQGADLVLRVVPKLEARSSADTDVVLELDDAEFDLLAKASQPRTRIHDPQELMQEARCRAVFLRSPAAEVAALGPIAQTTATPQAEPEVSGVRGHSGFGYGSQPYGMIANVPNLPPSMRPPTQAAPVAVATVPVERTGVTVLSSEQARALGAKTAEELGLAPMGNNPAPPDGAPVEPEADTTPPPPEPKTRIGAICYEMLTRFAELATRVPEVLPPDVSKDDIPERQAVKARRARLVELVGLTQNLGATADDVEASFAAAAEFEQALLDNLAELEREERAVLEALNAEALDQATTELDELAAAGPDTSRTGFGTETVGIPSVRKL